MENHGHLAPRGAVATARTPLILLVAAIVLAGAVSAVGRADATSTHAASATAAHTTVLHQTAHADQYTQWGPVPAGFPPGAELAVVQGDPAIRGAVFTIRLRMPNDYVLPPHFHPEDEHVTVLAGGFEVGLGNVVNTADTVASLQRSGFITAPKGHTHWGIARGQTVVQVHGIGPFQTTFVDEQGNPLSQ